MNRTLTARGVLLWMLALFIPVIAVNVYFIVLSVTTFRGEDEQRPYLQGIEYNDTLERRAVQEKLGWNATISASRLPHGKVQIAVALKQANGAPETAVTLHGELRHPADENRDRTLKLREVGGGLYEADLSGVRPGAWDVIVSTAAHDAPFEASRRVWVP